MSLETLRALRYAWGWTTGRARVEELEITVRRDDGTVPATLYLPAGRRRNLSGWVVLHGITRPGRAHPSLRRFARALAGTPAAVLVPEIPEWRELQLSPERSVPTIRAAVLTLDARAETRSGHTALAGFSFGAPQAIIASTHPALDGHLRGVVGFGGYADLPRTLRFLFTGEHEWRGETFRTPPDPYGRWLAGANYLSLIPDHRDAGDVEQALWRLASRAGELQVVSWDPIHDPVKEQLRATIAPRRRHLFDLYAPPSSREPPEGAEVEAMVEALAGIVDGASPLLDPRPYLGDVRVPVRLVHGRHDHLIPFTETLRLREAFPPDADVEADVSALFAHSGESGGGSPLRTIREGLRFLGILRKVLSLA